MNISTTTLSNLVKAIESIGDKEVNDILEIFSKRDVIVINEVVELCCRELDINKSFLRIKNNRTKTDLLSTIVYILRKNDINPGAIKQYFSDYTIRINEMFEYILNLSDNIPGEFKLKSIVNKIEPESKLIFEKYFINNTHHGTKETV